MKKLYSVFVLFTLLFCYTGNVWGAETLTVANGSTTNSYVPFYGYYADQNGMRSQIIYPASDIEAMDGGAISGITFYSTTNSWANSATFTVSLAEVDATSLSAIDEATSLTTVKTGYTLSTNASGEMEITFDTPFEYADGKNLLVDLTMTKKGSEQSKYYYGVTASGASYLKYGSSGSTTAQGFRPKATFTYTPPVITCHKPTDLAKGSVTSSSAAFTWSAGSDGESEWQYICLPKSTTLDWTSGDVQTATSTSASVSGLSANTAYKFYVRGNCGLTNGYSKAASLEFRTECGAIATAALPYELGFETGEECTAGNMPPCWSKIGSPSVIANSGYNTYAKTGTQAIHFNGTSEQYAILPLFETEVKNLQISFWYKNYYPSYYPSNLVLGTMTDPTDKTSFTEIKALSQTDSYTHIENESLASAPAGDYYIAFKYTATSSSAKILIDDLSVSALPSCSKPASINAASSITTSGATITWAEGNGETQWQYVVLAADAAESWASGTVIVNSREAILTGLSPETSYDFYVRSYCGASEQSASVKTTFTTECAQKSIPWTCGFEESEGYATGSYSSAAPNNCWTILNMNGSLPYAFVNTNSSYIRTGSKSLYFESATDRDGYLIFPELDAALNTLQIEFYHKEESATKSSTLTLGYMTDITDANSFVALKDDPFTRVADTWNHEEESLAGVPTNVASTARLAFKVGKTSNTNWYLGIDDITISELPSCAKPSITASDVIYNGATITWALGSSDNKWKLQYKASGDADWSNANGGNLIAASSFNLTGLTSGTTYQVRAQAECEGEWSNAVSFKPQCVMPTGLSVSSITTTTASVNWTVNSGENEWNIQYKKSSDASWTTIENVTTHPYSLTNLAPGSTYQVKVAATCNGTYTSAQEFDTECATVTSFPWVENFEDKTVNTIVKCWDISASATTTKSGSSNYYVWGVHSYSSNKMIRMYNYMVKDGSAIIYSPSITIPDDDKEYLLTFDYSNLANCGALKAKISINGGSTFTEVGSYTNASSTNEKENPGSFTTAKISLADYAGETIILQFYALANYSEGAIFVDNIKIAEKPDCTTPTGLTASSVAANTATISWTAGDEETNWALQYKTENGSWSDAIEVSTTPSHGLTGLSGNTLYYVRVKAVCGGGKESEYTDGTFNFRTECDTKTLPYEETFESGTSPECWTAMNGSYSYYDISGNNSWKVTLDNNNNYVMRYKSANNSVYPVLTLQQIALPENAVLRFKVRNIYSNKTVAGKVTISAAGVSDRVVTLTNSNSLTAHEVALDAFAGKTVTIKFQATSNAASAYLDIDDIRVARTITLADDTDNSSTLSTLAAAGETVDVLLSRNLLMDGDYNPLCLPFSLSAAQLADEDCPLNNFKLKVFDYTQEVGDELHLYIAGASSIEAGVPYFVSYQGTPSNTPKAQHLFRDVKITATTEGTKTHEKVTYQGTFAPTTLADQSTKSDNPEILFLGADNTIYYPNANVNLKGFRAYFTVDYSVGAPARAIRKICFGEQGENTATGIEDTDNAQTTRKRVENNQVIIIRDGVKYTVLGQKIQ